MQTLITTRTAHHATVAALQPLIRENDETCGHRIDPLKLAYLDFGLFKSLRKLGVSRERICSTLRISYGDFEYLCELSMP
jgi:hypothetical protein